MNFSIAFSLINVMLLMKLIFNWEEKYVMQCSDNFYAININFCIYVASFIYAVSFSTNMEYLNPTKENEKCLKCLFSSFIKRETNWCWITLIIWAYNHSQFIQNHQLKWWKKKIFSFLYPYDKKKDRILCVCEVMRRKFI